MGNDGFMMNSKVYDFLKWLSLMFLPAISGLYFALGQIWPLPAVDKVVGSAALVAAFLGALVNQSSKNFVKSPNNMVGVKPTGKVVVLQDKDGTVDGMSFVAYNDPLILEDQRSVVFDVERSLRV